MFDKPHILSLFPNSFTKFNRKGSGSVVECFTRERRAVGSSPTDVTALCP